MENSMTTTMSEVKVGMTKIIFRSRKWMRVQGSTTRPCGTPRLGWLVSVCYDLSKHCHKSSSSSLLFAHFIPLLRGGCLRLITCATATAGPGDESKMILYSTRKIMNGGWLSPKACSPRWDWRRLQRPRLASVQNAHFLRPINVEDRAKKPWKPILTGLRETHWEFQVAQ